MGSMKKVITLQLFLLKCRRIFEIESLAFLIEKNHGADRHSLTGPGALRENVTDRRSLILKVPAEMGELPGFGLYIKVIGSGGECLFPDNSDEVSLQTFHGCTHVLNRAGGLFIFDINLRFLSRIRDPSMMNLVPTVPSTLASEVPVKANTKWAREKRRQKCILSFSSASPFP